MFAVAVKEPVVDYGVALHQIQASYKQTNGTLYWRMAQVYYALRDLCANVRGWNNRMGFEVIAQVPQFVETQENQSMFAAVDGAQEDEDVELRAAA